MDRQEVQKTQDMLSDVSVESIPEEYKGFEDLPFLLDDSREESDGENRAEDMPRRRNGLTDLTYATKTANFVILNEKAPNTFHSKDNFA